MRALFIWNKGFTLVELVGAVVIIGILVGIVAISAGTSRQRTIDTRVKADIEAINAAKGLYSLDHNGGGTTFNNLSDPDGKFAALAPYLSTERTYSNIQDFQAPGYSYTINNLSTSATATGP